MLMRRRRSRAIFVSLILVAFATPTAMAADGPMSSGYKGNMPAADIPAEKPPAADAKGPLDVRRLFAGTCGWCHSDGGRAAGKGPKLMGTPLTDAEIANRIKMGKTGAMPAFGSAFNNEEIQAIVAYIRGLREDGAAK
jgi:mono/diheme cytochrome c family protein